jgi:hypothetical protein
MAAFQGVFERMAFPPYKYKEYPKWVKNAAGADVLVHSQTEEIRLEMAKVDEAVEVNPLLLENAKLAQQIAELTAQLSTQTPKPSIPETKVLSEEETAKVKATLDAQKAKPATNELIKAK